MHTKSCSFNHTHTYTRVGSNRNYNRLAENDEVNSDPYHTVPKSSTVEEITHHRRFPNYILSKKLRKRKNTRVILTRREYLRVNNTTSKLQQHKAVDRKIYLCSKNLKIIWFRLDSRTK